MATTMQQVTNDYTSLDSMRHAVLLDPNSSKLAVFLQRIKDFLQNRVIGYNGLLSAPSTTSTQATAGVGNTTWNVNCSAMMAVVNGTIGEVAAAAVISIHSGSLLLATGSECVAPVCLYVTGAGVLTATAVKGDTSVTASASAVGPTDTTITTQVGTAALGWIRVGQTRLQRTADTTVVQTYDNTKRPVLGITTDETFWGTID